MRNREYRLNDANQDLMELLEWLDLKYEAYLCQVNMQKHEQVRLGGEEDTSEDAIRLIQSDHEMMILMTEKKIDQLSKIEEILESIESRTGSERKVVDQEVRQIEDNMKNMKFDKVLSEIKGI